VREYRIVAYRGRALAPRLGLESAGPPMNFLRGDPIGTGTLCGRMRPPGTAARSQRPKSATQSRRDGVGYRSIGIVWQKVASLCRCIVQPHTGRGLCGRVTHRIIRLWLMLHV
jgi:hypothetical protein